MLAAADVLRSIDAEAFRARGFSFGAGAKIEAIEVTGLADSRIAAMSVDRLDADTDILAIRIEKATWDAIDYKKVAGVLEEYGGDVKLADVSVDRLFPLVRRNRLTHIAMSAGALPRFVKPERSTPRLALDIAAVQFEQTSLGPKGGYRAVASLEHLTTRVPENISREADMVRAAGLSPLDLSGRFDWSWAPADGRLVIDDLSLSGVGLGSVALQLQLASVSPTLLSSETEGMDAALDKVRLESASVRIVDAGMVGKLLALGASMSGQTPAQVRASVVEAVETVVEGMLDNNTGRQMSRAIAVFIWTPGTLSITGKATGDLRIAELADLIDKPAELDRRFHIESIANGEAGRPTGRQ